MVQKWFYGHCLHPWYRNIILDYTYYHKQLYTHTHTHTHTLTLTLTHTHTLTLTHTHTHTHTLTLTLTLTHTHTHTHTLTLTHTHTHTHTIHNMQYSQVPLLAPPPFSVPATLIDNERHKLICIHKTSFPLTAPMELITLAHRSFTAKFKLKQINWILMSGSFKRMVYEWITECRMTTYKSSKAVMRR